MTDRPTDRAVDLACRLAVEAGDRRASPGGRRRATVASTRHEVDGDRPGHRARPRRRGADRRRHSPSARPDDGIVGEEGTDRAGHSRASRGSSTRSTARPTSSTACPLWSTSIAAGDGDGDARRRGLRPGARRAVRRRAGAGAPRSTAGRSTAATATTWRSRSSPPGSPTTPTGARARPRCVAALIGRRARHPPARVGGPRPVLGRRRALDALLRDAASTRGTSPPASSSPARPAAAAGDLARRPAATGRAARGRRRHLRRPAGPARRAG